MLTWTRGWLSVCGLVVIRCVSASLVVIQSLLVCVDCNVQVRYLVVWNPIIIMATQALLLAMGFTPDPPPEHHPVHVEVAGEGMHGQ